MPIRGCFADAGLIEIAGKDGVEGREAGGE
jgi:hypothetical protein